MKEFKGTKGEWSISKNEFGQFEVESEHSLICEPNGLTYKTQRANTQLIAAAPDLLKSNQYLLNLVKEIATDNDIELIEDDLLTISEAEAAIKKALGE